MNFLGHAAVARHHDDDPAYVLGAVLPDLLPMAGLRLDRSAVGPQVAAGWRDHHRVDAAFHASADFTQGVRALHADLHPLERGPRRAVAHVGWELLLDEVVADDADTLVAFRAALEAGRDLHPDAGWHRLLDRLAAGPFVEVALRVHRTVGRRPRLAFDAELVPLVADVLERHRPTVARVGPGLVAALSR